MADISHWVYVIAHNSPAGLTKPVKIGISSNPGARLGTIQTACPFPIELAYVFECPNREIAREIELSFHATQKEKQKHGEWFDFEPVHAIHLLCIAFRAALEHNLSDKSIIPEVLELCGVLSAEKRFNLAVPKGAIRQ